MGAGDGSEKGDPMVTIDRERCTGCATCVSDCIKGNVVVEEGAARILDDCFNCGHCVAICPAGACSIDEYPAQCVEYDPARFSVATENMLNTVKFRRSIRDYHDRPLSMEDLHVLMDAASHMPTAKNTQSCRFVFIQDSLEFFKEMIWGDLKGKYDSGAQTPLPKESLGGFISLREEEGVDYLFRNAPAVLLVEANDPVDAGLAAAAVELVGTTMGIGVLYNGYLRRAIDDCQPARAYLDSSEEKPLRVCMLVGYQKPKYRRTAPRRNPSVVLR